MGVKKGGDIPVGEMSDNVMAEICCTGTKVQFEKKGEFSRISRRKDSRLSRVLTKYVCVLFLR